MNTIEIMLCVAVLGFAVYAYLELKEELKGDKK
jgi:hypothetical protein